MFTINEMWSLILGGGVSLLCAIWGCVLLSGRGANLIAGYNTMTPNEKETWNKKTLCKAVGIYVIFIGIAIDAAMIIPIHINNKVNCIS